MKHCGAQQGGFTLLEVLVAMTIVGLGVVTVIEVFSMGLRLGSRSADQTEAMTYGRQVMEDFPVSHKSGTRDPSRDRPGTGAAGKCLCGRRRTRPPILHRRAHGNSKK